MFSKPNLTLFALLFLGNNVGEGEASAAAWNTAGLGHETWLRGGGKVRPRDVASESEERCDLAYAVFTFDLIPIPDYSRRTKEHCATTVAAHLLWPAGLLLRRKPLRLCCLNLGRDHLRQVGLLLRHEPPPAVRPKPRTGSPPAGRPPPPARPTPTGRPSPVE